MNPDFLSDGGMFLGLSKSFAAMCTAFLCVFSLGFSFSCLVKLIIPSKKSMNSSRSHAKSASFSCMCIFLTLAAVFYTMLIFLTSSLFVPSLLLKLHLSQGVSELSFYLIFSSVFLIGFLIAFIWKIFVPVFLIAFAFLTAFTSLKLKSFFGPQNNLIPVKIEENSFTVGGKSFSQDEVPALTLCSYTLPDSFFLPVKRNWFFISELHENAASPVPDFYFSNYLLKRKAAPVLIELPSETIYPSLFSVKISFPNGRIFCELERDL